MRGDGRVTGKGYSVFEMISAFSKVCRKEIPFVIKERRPGDIATCYADPGLAKEELGFTATKELMQIRMVIEIKMKNYSKLFQRLRVGDVQAL